MIKYCSKYDFNKYYKNKKIVCIGAGKRFEALVRDFDWNIILAIDNSPEKDNTYFNFLDKKILIRNWQYLLDNVQDDWILLITPKDYEPFVFDIMDYPMLCRLEIFINSKFDMFYFDDNRMYFERRPIVYRQKKESLIPKIIHFFWFSNDSYPPEVQKCIDSWSKFCPDYEIKKWDLTNYSSENVFFKEAIRCKKWAFASDYARADIIYKYGGIYLDSDVEVIRPLDELLYHDAFIGFEENIRVDPGSGFGAKKGNAIIKEFRDMYEDMHFVLPDGSYNILACPAYYTKILQNHGLFLNGSYQLLNEIAVYPTTAFCPHSYRTNLLYIEDDTYSIHHHMGSWHDEKGKRDVERMYAEIEKRGIRR